MSEVDLLIERINREDAELAKMRQEIQEVIDLAASRGVYLHVEGFNSKKPRGKR